MSCYNSKLNSSCVFYPRSMTRRYGRLHFPPHARRHRVPYEPPRNRHATTASSPPFSPLRGTAIGMMATGVVRKGAGIGGTGAREDRGVRDCRRRRAAWFRIRICRHDGSCAGEWGRARRRGSQAYAPAIFLMLPLAAKTGAGGRLGGKVTGAGELTMISRTGNLSRFGVRYACASGRGGHRTAMCLGSRIVPSHPGRGRAQGTIARSPAGICPASAAPAPPETTYLPGIGTCQCSE
jgi:hypothetical protein